MTKPMGMWPIVAEVQYDDMTEYDYEDEGFLVMNFALLCENGLDLQNEEAVALAAESLQLEYEAYMLRGHGKGKGQRHRFLPGAQSPTCPVESQNGVQKVCSERPLEWRCLMPKWESQRWIQEGLKPKYHFNQAEQFSWRRKTWWKAAQTTCGALLTSW